MNTRARCRSAWRFGGWLLALAALAQACGGGSSRSSGPGATRVELRFQQVTAARAGLLPQGCDRVELRVAPDGIVQTATDTKVSLLLVAGTHTISGDLFCGSRTFAAQPVTFQVPPGLRSIDVALAFGDVHVQLTVVVGPGVSVSGPGITCPGDCTETVIAGSSLHLTASPGSAVFSGGCSGTGACDVLLNADKTVFVNLGGGDLEVRNTASGSCCDIFLITFSGPGPISSISNLAPGESATRTGLEPGNYVASWCGGPAPFTIEAGKKTVLSLDGTSCG